MFVRPRTETKPREQSKQHGEHTTAQILSIEISCSHLLYCFHLPSLLTRHRQVLHTWTHEHDCAVAHGFSASGNKSSLGISGPATRMPSSLNKATNAELPSKTRFNLANSSRLLHAYQCVTTRVSELPMRLKPDIPLLVIAVICD